jgi:predicted membrane protein
MSGTFWSMSSEFWQVVGIVAVLVLVAVVLARPASILAVVLAFGIVVAAIVVTWQQVETYRAQKAANAANTQLQASTGVTVPPPNIPRSGS